MSTATTIQAHIAYEVINVQNPEIAISALRKVSTSVDSVNDEVEADATKNVAIRSAKNGSLAAASSLDDFGGRSDALGG
jgi:hypothetical protein